MGLPIFGKPISFDGGNNPSRFLAEIIVAAKHSKANA